MKSPTIIVCIKDVPDPEGPSSSYEIQNDLKKVVARGIPPVINPYDENALEVAIRLKDLWGGRVIALNMAERSITSVLKKALAVGADELILLESPLFGNLTSNSTALVLSAAIRKIGAYDLIVTGRQSADWNFGQVGSLVAEILKVPSVNLANKVELCDGAAAVTRLKRTGYETIAAKMPLVVTVSSEAGALRIPTFKAIRDTQNKPVNIWKMEDLDLDPASLKKKNIRAFTNPPSLTRNCLFIEGNSSQEKAENLVLRLRQDKVI